MGSRGLECVWMERECGMYHYTCTKRTRHDTTQPPFTHYLHAREHVIGWVQWWRRSLCYPSVPTLSYSQSSRSVSAHAQLESHKTAAALLIRKTRALNLSQRCIQDKIADTASSNLLKQQGKHKHPPAAPSAHSAQAQHTSSRSSQHHPATSPPNSQTQHSPPHLDACYHPP